MNHLTELCKDLMIDPQLHRDSRGFPILPITSSLAIAIQQLDLGYVLHSSISPCPKVKREEFFIHLMKGNLFGQGTLGGVIGLDHEEKFLTLSSSFPYEMDYRSFREAFEDFVNIVEYWREEVQLHEKQAREGIL